MAFFTFREEANHETKAGDRTQGHALSCVLPLTPRFLIRCRRCALCPAARPTPSRKRNTGTSRRWCGRQPRPWTRRQSRMAIAYASSRPETKACTTLCSTWPSRKKADSPRPWSGALPGGFFVVEHAASGELVASCVAWRGSSSPRHGDAGQLGWLVTDSSHTGEGLGSVVAASVTNRLAGEGYRRSIPGYRGLPPRGDLDLPQAGVEAVSVSRGDGGALEGGVRGAGVGVRQSVRR